MRMVDYATEIYFKQIFENLRVKHIETSFTKISVHI